MKFLTVNASPHRNSVTERFCRTFESIVPCRRLNLHDDPPAFSSGRYTQKRNQWQEVVLKSRVVFIATPTYWYNVPSILKAFIESLTNIEDELYEKERFMHIAVYAPEGGEIGAINALMAPMNMMGFTIPAGGHSYYRGRHDKWAWRNIRETAQRYV